VEEVLMGAIVKVTGSGQITIPAAMRRHLNIETGDRVMIQENASGGLEVKPLSITLEDLVGWLPPLDREVDDDFGNVIRESQEEWAAEKMKRYGLK
jgi:AbrB family looped-hinge helix DNA binding protein